MFIVHLIRPDNTCTPLAFALSDSEASHLVSACAMQYIESQCGSERCSSAFEPPNAEGMYLVKESDVSLRVQQKKAVVVAAGWFTSESLTVEDTLVGHIRADEFHVENTCCPFRRSQRRVLHCHAAPSSPGRPCRGWASSQSTRASNLRKSDSTLVPCPYGVSESVLNACLSIPPEIVTKYGIHVFGA